MYDGASLFFANPLKQLLKRHFGNCKIISLHFPTASPSRSPDLYPCDFWLWGYLKDAVLSTSIAPLAELKVRIAQHILKVTQKTQLSVVENFNFLQKTVELKMFCTRLAKFKNQFHGCFLCGFWP